MKPAPFEYHAPRDAAEAVQLLARHGDDARVLAGGQSLVPMLALRLSSPAHLVDIGGIDAFRGLSADRRGDGPLTIGAAVSQRTLERQPHLRASFPALADALPLIAHPPIRNRGTVCGSLAHADPAAELPAVALALDATLVATSERGVRLIAADDFFRSYYETALESDELLVEVRVPWPAPGTRSAFVELSRRSGDFALAGVAAVVTVEDARITDARLAACGVAPTPVRLRDAEDALRGQPHDGCDLGEVAQLAARDLDPPSDVHAPGSYRRRMTSVLTRRALAAALERDEAA